MTEYEQLEDNWNGEKGFAPRPRTIEAFRSIVEPIDWPECLVYADPSGTMDIEDAAETVDYWEIVGGFHLCVGQHHWSMYVRVAGEEEIHFFKGATDEVFPYRSVQRALDHLKEKRESIPFSIETT